jgi:hypothetical protein
LEGGRILFFFPYFFSWTKKVTKKSRTKEWLRPFVRLAHPLQDWRRNNYLNIWDVRGKVLDSAACGAGQREALCPALKVFIIMCVLKYGGARRWGVVLVWGMLEFFWPSRIFLLQ